MSLFSLLVFYVGTSGANIMLKEEAERSTAFCEAFIKLSINSFGLRVSVVVRSI